MNITSSLHSTDFDNTRVFLRADLNVPIIDKTITNDFRLQALLPTIDLLLQKGAKIVLGTHIGRPKDFNASLSTEILVPWFEKHGYKIEFEPGLERAQQKSLENQDTILLLENLRFFPGERKHDPAYVEDLERLADYYINDAFGVMHRNDCSVTDLPRLFAPDRCSIGLLVEQELQILNQLLDAPKKPFILIIGGAKISSKLPLLRSLIKKVDNFLLCPAIVFTFLKALKKPVGNSLVDDNLLHESKKFLDEAKEKILFPVDYQIAQETFDGPISFVESTEIPDGSVGVSIGPKTENLFAEKIANAETIFFNGAIGNMHNAETLRGTQALLTAMGKSKALTVVAGGESVALTQLFGLNMQMDYCSTGGGATLAYLAGEDLPGLETFIKEK